MTHRKPWLAAALGWTRRSRTTIPYGDGFGVGVTRATADNTGCRVVEADLVGTADEIWGDVYLTTPNQVFSHKLVHGSVYVQAVGVVIEDVIVDVPATSGVERNGIYNWHSAATGNVIRFVTIRCLVANQSYWIGSGVHGSGFEAYRVKVVGMTDAFTIAGVNKRSYGRVRGCWIDHLPHYDYDGYPGKAGSHSDGSHPDGIVAEGNLTYVEIVGNSVPGNYTSAIFLTQNQGSYDSAPVITDNWVRYEGGSVGSYVNLTKNMPSISALGVVLHRNRYESTVSTGTGGPAKMFIPSALLATMQSLGQITSSGPNRNVFLDATGAPTSAPVPLYTGVSPSLTTY